MPSTTFLLCDLLSGRVLTELPLSYGDSIKRLIGRVESQSFTLPVMDQNCPDDWDDLLVPGKSMIVLNTDGALAQGWTVDEAEVGDTTVPITTSTLETCLARSNVPDLDSAGMDLSDAAAALVADQETRFGFTIESQPCGKPAEEEYSNLEDRNQLDALNALQATPGGPEWRIALRWADADRRVIEKVIEIQPRIGATRPDAVFELDTDGGGNIASYRRKTSYAAGKGATYLIGTSEGSGVSRPMTDPQPSALLAQGWPIWEERKNFTGVGLGDVDEDTELLERTLAVLAQRESGTVIWAVTGTATAPQPGTDMDTGDTVPVVVAPQGKLDPKGGTASLRVLGWDWVPVSGRVTLILWDDGETTDG